MTPDAAKQRKKALIAALAISPFAYPATLITESAIVWILAGLDVIWVRTYALYIMTIISSVCGLVGAFLICQIIALPLFLWLDGREKLNARIVFVLTGFVLVAIVLVRFAMMWEAFVNGSTLAIIGYYLGVIVLPGLSVGWAFWKLFQWHSMPVDLGFDSCLPE